MPATPFEVTETEIDGLVVISVKHVEDERGTVRELFRESTFRDANLPSIGPWVQVNLTRTRAGAIRGMHGEQVYKLVGVASGQAFGAYVDARPASPTLGKVVTLDLIVGTEVLVPVGVCNGFQALGAAGPGSPAGPGDGSGGGGETEYLYCFDVEWTPEMTGVAVNAFDPALGIPWPIEIDREDRSLLSERDASLPSLDEALAGSKP